jgi:hypothetical protein
MIDVVERLLQPIGLHHWPALDAERAEAAAQIKKLRAALQLAADQLAAEGYSIEADMARRVLTPLTDKDK